MSSHRSIAPFLFVLSAFVTCSAVTACVSPSDEGSEGEAQGSTSSALICSVDTPPGTPCTKLDGGTLPAVHYLVATTTDTTATLSFVTPRGPTATTVTITSATPQSPV